MCPFGADDVDVPQHKEDTDIIALGISLCRDIGHYTK